MITFRKDIWDKDEYNYKAAYGFMPNIHGYIHDDDEVRACMLVVPGGGYCMVVPPEAEIVAKRFYEEGRNIFDNILKNYPKRLDIWNIYIDIFTSSLTSLCLIS